MNLVNISEPDKKNSTNILCLGIDFGTTNSVCSVKIDEKIIYIEDSKKKLIPSIVFFKNQKVYIGNQIKNSSISELIFSVKRFLQGTACVANKIFIAYFLITTPTIF